MPLTHVRVACTLLILCMSLALAVHAEAPQAAVSEWTRVYRPESVPSCLARDVAVDANSNLLFTAAASIPNSYGVGVPHILTGSFSPDGNLRWADIRGGSPLGMIPRMMAIAPDGNVFIGGRRTPGDAYQLLKYSAEGSHQWDRAYSLGIGSQEVEAMAFEPDGSIILGGTGRDDYYFGSGLQIVAKLWIVKASSDGTKVWGREVPAHGDAYFSGMAQTPDGNIVAVGSEDNFRDVVVVKLNSSGTILWRAISAAEGGNFAPDVKVDPTGNIYVLTHGSRFIGLPFPNNRGIRLLKYDPEGNLLWSAVFNRPDTVPTAVKLALDLDGNIYVCGYSQEWATGNDCLILKYSPDGVQLWRRWFNGYYNGDDRPVRMQVVSGGSVILTLRSGDVSKLLSAADITTVRYDPEGNLQWVRQWSGPPQGWDEPTGLAASPDGALYVGGSTQLSSNSSAAVLLKYSLAGSGMGTPAPPANLRAQPFSLYSTQLSWDDQSGNEDAFIVERQDGTTFRTVGSLAPNVTSHEDYSMFSVGASGLTGTYRVAAVNSAGVSEFTAPQTVTTFTAGGRLVVPARLNCGVARGGRTREATLSLRNADRRSSLWVNLRQPSAAQFQLVAPPQPLQIAPGRTAKLRIQFRSATVGVFRGTLELGSSDPQKYTFSVALSGTARR